MMKEMQQGATTRSQTNQRYKPLTAKQLQCQSSRDSATHALANETIATELCALLYIFILLSLSLWAVRILRCALSYANRPTRKQEKSLSFFFAIFCLTPHTLPLFCLTLISSQSVCYLEKCVSTKPVNYLPAAAVKWDGRIIVLFYYIGQMRKWVCLISVQTIMLLLLAFNEHFERDYNFIIYLYEGNWIIAIIFFFIIISNLISEA